MKLLLDTHIFLWYISNDKRLSKSAQNSIRDINNQVYLSVVSIWEAIVKYKLGKLPLPYSPELYLPIQRNQHQIYPALIWMKQACVSLLIFLPFTVIHLPAF